MAGTTGSTTGGFTGHDALLTEDDDDEEDWTPCGDDCFDKLVVVTCGESVRLKVEDDMLATEGAKQSQEEARTMGKKGLTG